MAHEKLKSENYHQFGGINSKVSPYVTGPMEFLDLSNLDFQTPGSLSQRWGSTQYIGQTSLGPINSLFEFSKLDGSSYIVFSYSGGIFYGATTGQHQGVSLSTLGVTLQYWQAVNYLAIHPPIPSGANSAYMYSIGAFYLGSTGSPKVGTDAPATNNRTGSTFYINPLASQSDNVISQAMLDNYLFLADGNKFLKFDGITTTPVGLPPALWATNGTYDPQGNVTSDRGFGSKTLGTTTGVGFQYGPSFGCYYLYASYVNNRGFEGPIWPICVFNADTQFNASLTTSLGPGATGILNVSLMIATPIQYGISAINIYSFYDPYNPSIGQTYTNFLGDSFYQTIEARFWNLGTPCLLQTIAASGSTFTSFAVGTSSGGQTLMQGNVIGVLESSTTTSYTPLGLTLSVTAPSQYTNYEAMTGFYPRFLENFENRIFLAGFSTTPSTVWFSDIAEPEGFRADFNFEVRTNDGDVITAIKAYQTRLYVLKKSSFHVLSGDDPVNFFVQQISDQYGCLNNRSTVVFENMFAFLDRKGVVLWDGANVSLLSAKIQPIFDRMNFSAALTTACAVHDKLRNQIIFAIPIDGSSTNNLTVVYDYLVPGGGWTTYKGVNISALARIQGRNNTKNAFYGDYSGRVNWFGSSFLSDNGVGFTAYLKSRFLHDLGDSTQKMFRRLYVNTDAPNGTLVFGVNLYQDYGSSVVLGTTVVSSQFQSRIDFGISGKSLAFELSNLQTSIPLKIHGFTIESRFLRRV